MPSSQTDNPKWCECKCCGFRIEALTKEDFGDKVKEHFGWERRSGNYCNPYQFCILCRHAGCRDGEPCQRTKVK